MGTCSSDLNSAKVANRKDSMDDVANLPFEAIFTDEEAQAFSIKRTPLFGPSHRDTKVFDDEKELGFLFEYRICKITVWYGTLMPSGVVNGIQFKYRNINTGEVVTTTARFGNHQLAGKKEFKLRPDEYIVSASVRHGGVIDGLSFTTNQRQTIQVGGNGGQLKEVPMAEYFILGTYGGYGGHLHNIGFYLVPIQFAMRKPSENVIAHFMKQSRDYR